MTMKVNEQTHLILFEFHNNRRCVNLKTQEDDAGWPVKNLEILLPNLNTSRKEPHNLKRKTIQIFFSNSIYSMRRYQIIEIAYLCTNPWLLLLRACLPLSSVSHTSALLFTLHSQVLCTYNLCYFAVDSSCLISHVWHLHLIPFHWQCRTASGEKRSSPE